MLYSRTPALSNFSPTATQNSRTLLPKNDFGKTMQNDSDVTMENDSDVKMQNNTQQTTNCFAIVDLAMAFKALNTINAIDEGYMADNDINATDEGYTSADDFTALELTQQTPKPKKFTTGRISTFVSVAEIEEAKARSITAEQKRFQHFVSEKVRFDNAIKELKEALKLSHNESAWGMRKYILKIEIKLKRIQGKRAKLEQLEKEAIAAHR
jgi:hypothetical protein